MRNPGEIRQVEAKIQASPAFSAAPTADRGELRRLVELLPRAYHVISKGMGERLEPGSTGSFVGVLESPLALVRRAASGVWIMEAIFADIDTGRRVQVTRMAANVNEAIARSIVDRFNEGCADRPVFLRGAMDVSPRMFDSRMSLSEHHAFGAGFERTYREMGSRSVLLPIYPLTGNQKQADVRREQTEGLRLAKADPDAFHLATLDFQLSPEIAGVLEAAGCQVLDLLVAVRALHGDYLMPPHQVAPLLGGSSLPHRRMELPRAVRTLCSMDRFSDEPPVSAVSLRQPIELSGLLSRWKFRPTGAQARVVAEIAQQFRDRDTRERLVQGDVGAGKTAVIAAAAALMFVQGYSTVLCAPTEILANQLADAMRSHIDSMLGSLAAGRVVRYKSNSSQKAKDALLKRQSRAPLVVVGTHGAVRAPVANLGLAVFDEEHRFSREVKRVLREDHPSSHLLQVTATPIPRSLAATVYGGALVSVLDEYPAGRQAIASRVVEEDIRATVIEAIRDAVGRGGRAYVVCPAIGSQLMAGAEQWSEDLAEALMPSGVAVGLIHGEMSPRAADDALSAFKRGETAVLVGTSIMAVGVDVPEATLMVILDPQMMGVAQLHQIRGRVGRGEAASECLFCPVQPISDEQRNRLHFVASTQDGFALAEFDLEQRGAGSLDGVSQSGGDLDWTWFSSESEAVLAHLESVRAAQRDEHIFDYGF